MITIKKKSDEKNIESTSTRTFNGNLTMLSFSTRQSNGLSS